MYYFVQVEKNDFNFKFHEFRIRTTKSQNVCDQIIVLSKKCDLKIPKIIKQMEKQKYFILRTYLYMFYLHVLTSGGTNEKHPKINYTRIKSTQSYSSLNNFEPKFYVTLSIHRQSYFVLYLLCRYIATHKIYKTLYVHVLHF